MPVLLNGGVIKRICRFGYECHSLMPVLLNGGLKNGRSRARCVDSATR